MTITYRLSLPSHYLKDADSEGRHTKYVRLSENRLIQRHESKKSKVQYRNTGRTKV